ncbi:MAG: NGG1p interacting factor NIF3 [Spirochaetaceae bacterium]|nr:MAG: NGG1p interacting factor NIF3 [Spirochaetaceae bacterium]
MTPMHKLIFFVPAEHAEAVKRAVFAAGAGRYRNYDCCSWQTAGTGQFRPLAGADPFIGSVGAVETVPELRVETICTDESVRTVLDALIAAHPYEEPAYEVVRIWTIDDLPGD